MLNDCCWQRSISEPVISNVRAKLRIFATPMLGDRPSYDFRKSAHLLIMGVAEIRNLARTRIRTQLVLVLCVAASYP